MSYKTLIGKPAPVFKLKNYDGQDYDFKPGETGIPDVLLFYPHSGSYGCTKQACQFRDAMAERMEFAAGKVRIIGISPDSVEQQKAFVKKEKLAYPVLSDMKKEVFSTYGVGRGMMGLVHVARVTFVIDKHGIIRDAFDATANYGAHTGFVEGWLRKLKEDDTDTPSSSVSTKEV